MAKQLVADRKRDRALLALKRRRLHEQRLASLDAWLLNVEQLVGRPRMSRSAGPLLETVYLHAEKLHLVIGWRHRGGLMLLTAACVVTPQLSNIEVAKQQNRLFEALAAGSEAVKDLQQQVLALGAVRPLALPPCCPRP